MYSLKPGIKQDPVRRWALPDRIFFGFGGCHILAGVFLDRFSSLQWHAVQIKPAPGFRGSHVFVTDGVIAFDYHGYCGAKRLLRHHENGWINRVDGWSAQSLAVDFPLLDTSALNARQMRGPDQYLGNPITRAERFLERFDHYGLRHRARARVSAAALSE